MIQIITDSMSDIRQSEAHRYALTVLPQHVRFGDESYMDGVTLSCEEFYEKLSAAAELPKTSQVSPAAFAATFEAALGRGDEVICIAGSSNLSGNYQSALLARDMQTEGAPIFILDSLNASIGEQVLIWEAVRLRDADESAEAIVAKLNDLMARIVLVGRVDNLKHLVLGGRLSSAKARIGSTLKLKPVLRMRNGELDQDGLTRGKKRSFEWLMKQLEAEPRDERFPLYLASANTPVELSELREYLGSMARGDVREAAIGPIVGTHTGQGVLAVSWVRKAN